MQATIPRIFQRRLVFIIALLIFAARPASATNCGDLVRLKIPDVTVTSATNVAAGQFIPPASSNALETPEFCRVVAVARPTSDSVINFEVWIPSAERWNHDFEGVGNGGYTGAIQYAELAVALRRGFATASTDTGHTCRVDSRRQPCKSHHDTAAKNYMMRAFPAGSPSPA